MRIDIAFHVPAEHRLHAGYWRHAGLQRCPVLQPSMIRDVDGGADAVQKDPMGATRIRPLKDGPVEVSGELSLVGAQGSESPVGESPVYLCRCGHSADKPFCDGSHKKAGFVADGWQRVSTRR
jgi:CDGSH-type Zn-finger protein